MGIADKMKTAPAMAFVMKSSLPRAFTMMSRRGDHDPPRQHWHIGPVGVHPESQGRGVGTMLLECILATIDEQDAAAFLETDVDRNVTLYGRLGFQVTESEEIVGVNTRFMWRNARVTNQTSG
jgi:ribosomal protein S18 acetylase RimI-like enzyme